MPAPLGPPISMACGAGCPNEPGAEHAVQVQAQRHWLERGACSGQLIEACAGGGSSMTTGQGLCATRWQFDAHGDLVFLEGGCEGRLQRYGFRRACTVVTTRDVCDETRATLALRSVELAGNATVALTLDGAPVLDAALERGVTVSPGPHTLSLGGTEYGLDFALTDGPGFGTVKLTPGAPSARVTPGRRPDRTGAAGREAVCSALPCEFFLEAGVREEQARVSLTPRLELRPADAGL